MSHGRFLKLSIFVLFLLVSCESNPKMRNLRDGVDMMESIVKSNAVMDIVRNADPDMKPSTCVAAVFSSTVAAARPTPPEGIGFSPEVPTKAWIVVVKADDNAKEVIIEGYGETTEKPVISRKLKYPPK